MALRRYKMAPRRNKMAPGRPKTPARSAQDGPIGSKTLFLKVFIEKKQIRLHLHGICLDFKVFHACSQAFQLIRASRSLAETGFVW